MNLDKILTKENIDIGILSGLSSLIFPVSVLESYASIQGFYHNVFNYDTSLLLGSTGVLELGAVGLALSQVYEIYKSKKQASS